jgi:hypothetical protein
VNLFGSEDLDRVGRFRLGSPQVRSCDDDFLQLCPGVFGSVAGGSEAARAPEHNGHSTAGKASAANRFKD